MSTLTKKFQEFVGQEVKHPQRVTCDVCPVSAALSDAAFEEGLILAFTIAGKPVSEFDDVIDPGLLLVDLKENDNGKLVIDSFKIS